MLLTILINDFETLAPTQTTTMLMQAATSMEHTVAVIPVQTLSMNPDNHVYGKARFATHHTSRKELIQELLLSTPQTWQLDQSDVILIRTNPSRDVGHHIAHQVSLMMLQMLKQKGVLILNDPDGLCKAANKLYLSSLPASTRPLSLISSQPDDLKAFINQHSHSVLKPLQGTRGQDVFFLTPNNKNNHNQLLDVLTRNGPAIAQEYLTEASEGDVRVVVMDGEPLSLEGEYAAIRRVPGEGELRSNIHAGGIAQKGHISDEMMDTIKQIKPILQRDGLFLVGLDFIGHKLVEVNVFSTGGLRDAELFTKQPFTQQIIHTIETKHQQQNR